MKKTTDNVVTLLAEIRDALIEGNSDRRIGYDDVYSLNHRAYVEIKREDKGFPPF